MNLPADLRAALAAAPKARARWENITPIARRDFVSWVTSAKREETRRDRVARACSMLAAGKSRPCCYAVVPLEIYRALATSAPAKAYWKTLSPDARRDLVARIGDAKAAAAREIIEKAARSRR